MAGHFFPPLPPFLLSFLPFLNSGTFLQPLCPSFAIFRLWRPPFLLSFALSFLPTFNRSIFSTFPHSFSAANAMAAVEMMTTAKTKKKRAMTTGFVQTIAM
jgi:hypothetical protein